MIPRLSGRKLLSNRKGAAALSRTVKTVEITVGENKGESAPPSVTPFDVATEMRRVGATRIQDHDFLHVFETTEKPKISGPLAIEMRLLPEEQQKWIKSELSAIELEPLDKCAVGECLQLAKEFDEFLAHKFPTVKRYGLEGSESILLWFDALLAEMTSEQHAVIGMTHRGRNNLLTLLLGLKPEIMFAKMSGKAEFPEDGEHERIIGDVLSHLSISTKLESGLDVTLLPNPSHLDAINPGAMGKTRSKIEKGKDSVCIQCHGDGSLIGQGHNHELLNMQSIPGYSVGGSLHFCCDNNVAFTASGNLSRSAARPGDCALPYGSPVISVSGSAPERVVHAAKLAMRFRNKFGKDVMTELVAWRKYGHNELDEPRITNPLLYKHVDEAIKEPTPDKWTKNLPVADQETIGKRVEKAKAEWNAAFESRLSYVPQRLARNFGPWAELNRASSHHVSVWDTGVEREQLRYVLAKSVDVPDDFTLHGQLDRHKKQRLEAAQTGRKIDWGCAEAMAFGTLLQEGKSVRIAGQEAGRATFAHRHAILTDQNSEAQVIPLADLGSFAPINAPLTEQAVMAFEWGFAIDNPDNLVIWEAQFGDFWNQAQVTVDTLVTCSEQKWGLQSSLIMLLPHGFDGAGPEHSSSRVERFLQLTDSLENGVDPDNVNLQVLWPSTAAQYFHLVRRQMARDYRKPAAVVMPKTLLRLSGSMSTMEDMTPGTHYRTVIDEGNSKEAAKIIVTCGKHYFTLAEERQKRGLDKKVALIRLEEISPFPAKTLQETIGAYSGATEFLFAQEEPRNCGAWSFVKPRLDFVLGQSFRYAGRPEMPTSATGNGSQHKQQMTDILKDAFD